MLIQYSTQSVVNYLDMKSQKLLEKIGSNIRHEREALGWSQGDLAQRCQWKDGATRISNYELGLRDLKTSDLVRIANALGVQIQRLVDGGTSEEGKAPLINYSGLRSIPLLEASEVDGWLNYNTLSPKKDRSFYMFPTIIGEKGFCLLVEGNAMVSQSNPSVSYFPGDIVAVNPEKKPTAGDVVAVELDFADLKIRQYVKDGTTERLEPFNTSYDVLILGQKTEILGVIEGSYRPASAIASSVMLRKIS